MNQRLFIAIPIPLLWREKLVGVTSKLQSSIPNVRWISQENFHMTLFFMGNVDTNLIPPIKTTLKEFARKINGFSLYPEMIITGPPGRPSMIWFRFQENQEFSALATVVQRSLSPFTTDKQASPHRDQIPHITLARFRGNFNEDPLKIVDVAELGVLDVEMVSVYSSTLTETGATYEELASYPLMS